MVLHGCLPCCCAPVKICCLIMQEHQRRVDLRTLLSLSPLKSLWRAQCCVLSCWVSALTLRRALQLTACLRHSSQLPASPRHFVLLQQREQSQVTIIPSTFCSTPTSFVTSFVGTQSILHSVCSPNCLSGCGTAEPNSSCFPCSSWETEQKPADTHSPSTPVPSHYSNSKVFATVLLLSPSSEVQPSPELTVLFAEAAFNLQTSAKCSCLGAWVALQFQQQHFWREGL